MYRRWNSSSTNEEVTHVVGIHLWPEKGIQFNSVSFRVPRTALPGSKTLLG